MRISDICGPWDAQLRNNQLDADRKRVVYEWIESNCIYSRQFCVLFSNLPDVEHAAYDTYIIIVISRCISPLRNEHAYTHCLWVFNDDKCSTLNCFLKFLQSIFSLKGSRPLEIVCHIIICKWVLYPWWKPKCILVSFSSSVRLLIFWKWFWGKTWLEMRA